MRDNKTLTTQKNHTHTAVDKKKTTHKPHFVKTTKTNLTLNKTTLTQTKQLTNLKNYITNLNTTIIPTTKMIANYHNL